MARKEFLSCLEKRELLNQSATSVDSLARWGRQFEDQGSVFDAVDFYAKANDREALDRLMKRAAGEGDVFLFKQVCRALKYEPGREEWIEIAKKAEEAGKLSLAAQAYRMGGEEEALEKDAPSATA